VVVKFDDLAAGKGVRVVNTIEEARKAIDDAIVKQIYGDHSDIVLIEQFLHPHPSFLRAELSVLVIVDQFGNYLVLLPAQDYKPINSGDTGPNTGGMGAFAPVPWVTKTMMKEIVKRIIEPTIAEMEKRETPFTGVLYCGLMYTEEGFKVVEYNVRFGDPEIQPILALLKNDLFEILYKVACGESIADINLEWLEEFCVCLVLATKGYPGDYDKGFLIEGRLNSDYSMRRLGVDIGLAGVRRTMGYGYGFKTWGGRVGNIIVTNRNLKRAADIARQTAKEIRFVDDSGRNMAVWRDDIGDQYW